MKQLYYIIFTLLLVFTQVYSFIFPQTDSSYLQTEEILEDILQEPVGEFDESDLYDQFEQLLLNPIDLNKATIDDLIQIPELDISSARLILEHRKRYGNFFSLGELNAIQGIDKNLIK